MGERQEADGAATGGEGDEEKLAEINYELRIMNYQEKPDNGSMERLTVERFEAAVQDWMTKEQGFPEAVRHGFNSPSGQLYVARALAAFSQDPRPDAFAASLAVAFWIGWECREALMESEELERMAR